MRRPLKRAAYDSGIPPALPAAAGGGRRFLSGAAPPVPRDASRGAHI